MDQDKSENLTTGSGGEKASDCYGANASSTSIFDIPIQNSEDDLDIGRGSHKLPPFQDFFMSPTEREGMNELTIRTFFCK